MNFIECVPNFSEGRDPEKIKKITDAIETVHDVRVLHVHSNETANRTVITFAGHERIIGEAAFRAIQTASEVIDMSTHTGAHPRIGATDVCPFIPLGNTSMETCVHIARSLGNRVAEKLNIPVYLYEKAASSPERSNLANLRKGGYEGLAERMKYPEWVPDFGPPVPHPAAGATVIGARPFLIALNMNLNTNNLLVAKRIARQIRTSGFEKTLPDGKKMHHPGFFPACKAIGWFMPQWGIVQISVNLTDYKTTPPHKVFEMCKKMARRFHVEVTGSELIGLIPLDAMLAAGRYYIREKHLYEMDEESLIHAAIKGLGLHDLDLFDPRERILEYRLKELDKG